MLIPFKPFSSVLGEELSWWARANLPMNSGCAALPGACPNLGALLDSMFKVPMSQLYAGYTFPAAGEEGSTNPPFTGEPVSWAGETPELEPFGPFKSTWEYLTAPPTGIETVSLGEVFATTVKFGKAMFDAFYRSCRTASGTTTTRRALRRCSGRWRRCCVRRAIPTTRTTIRGSTRTIRRTSTPLTRRPRNRRTPADSRC